MPTSEHVLEIEQSFIHDGYRACCSCGWESRNVSHTTAEATDEWENHCDAVFMEATGG